MSIQVSNLLSVQWIGVASGLGFLAYCIYFDRKRRSAPDYRQKVQARRLAEKLQREARDDIKIPPLSDKGAIEKLIVDEIELGEELLQGGEVDRAVIHLSYAVALCPQPAQLLQYMREVLPTSAHAKLVEAVPKAQHKIREANNISNHLEDEVE